MHFLSLTVPLLLLPHSSTSSITALEDRVSALEKEVADHEATHVAQQDALAQSLLELVQLKERIGKRVDDEDAAAPLPQGRPGIRGRRQDIEGFAWLPSTEASQKQRRRRALWREVA